MEWTSFKPFKKKNLILIKIILQKKIYIYSQTSKVFN